VFAPGRVQENAKPCSYTFGRRTGTGTTLTFVRVDIRTITVGHVHAEQGDPHKVVEIHRWLMDNPELDLLPLDVRVKNNGTYRIHDGRHRFLAYVLAERATVPITLPPDG
jgi:hypothetical protein